MKVNFLLTLSVLLTVTLLGLVKLRHKEQEREEKRYRFQDIKLRVTRDVVGEYQAEVAAVQNQVDKTTAEVKTLEDEVVKLQTTETQKRGDTEACLATKKHMNDELALEESQRSDVKSESEKQKTSWEAEVASLKQQIAQRSKVCDFVNKDSATARKLCGGEVKEAPKPVEPKAEAPKPVEPKAEAPKPVEPKAEAPKQEEPKAEAPKQEEPKAEAPKQDKPKAEAPKQEEAKAEAPKQR
ncbi:small ribosomal subunit protein bS16 isoform X2 [Centroberyx affinis]|uniref:small ribosomal subunit protein bS16 isoform X2 n=1 Tax=Centroberyx affinis TaxID=166261 RepID=UPI003A5B9B37